MKRKTDEEEEEGEEAEEEEELAVEMRIIRFWGR